MKDVYVKVKNIGQLRAVIDDENVAAVICGTECVSELVSKEFISRIKKIAKNSEKKIYIELPDVLREKSLYDAHQVYSQNEPDGLDKDIGITCKADSTKEKEKVFKPQQLKSTEKILEGIRTKQIYADGVVIENLDALGMLVSSNYQGDVIGGSFLYAYNSEAVKFYKSYFPNMRFIAPAELTLTEINEINHEKLTEKRTDEFTTEEIIEISNKGKYSDNHMINGGMLNTVPFIYKIYGHQPVMITNLCMNRNYFGCEKSLLEFKDEKNNNFYITSECGQCYNIIYNGPVTYMLDRLDEIGNHDILLDFTIETPDEVRSIMEALKDSLTGKKIKAKRYTRGHFYNGID